MSDFLQGASWYFQTGWAFLTSFNLPGTNFTPAAALFMAAFVPIMIRFIRSMIGLISPRSGGSSSGHGGVSGPPALPGD